MGTRFGRRTAGGTYEYHDSEASLRASEDAEAREIARTQHMPLFGTIGLLLGGILTHAALSKLGAHLPPSVADWAPQWLAKACRFVLVIAGAGTGAWLLARSAQLIWATILALFAAGIVCAIGALLWKVV
jgi:hypothetical protein